MKEIATFPRELVFRNWCPGNIYTQHLVITNIRREPINVTYKTTSTPEFHVPFPETCKLFRGNSCRIPVRFEPTRRQKYVDEVEVEIKEWMTCVVKLTGQLSALLVDLDTRNLAFGEQPCSAAIAKILTVSNKGERDVAAEVVVDDPFSVDPLYFVIPALESKAVSVTFNATKPAEYQRTALFHFDDGEEKCMQSVHLVAKCRSANYVTLQPQPNDNGEIQLNYGELPVGNRVVRTFAVLSTLEADVPFELYRSQFEPQVPSRVLSQCCQPDISFGTLRPNKWQSISITFAARYACPRISETFVFRSGRERSCVSIVCTGSAAGPMVVPSEEVLDFGRVFITETHEKVLRLENVGRSETFFQFDCDPHTSLFTPNPVSGVLLPCSTAVIIVKFAAKHPGIFRATMTLTVHSQGIIRIEAIGTCYNSTITPQSLTPQHLAMFDGRLSIPGKPLIQRGPQAIRSLVDCGQLLPKGSELVHRPDLAETSNSASIAIACYPQADVFLALNKWIQSRLNTSLNAVTCNKQELLFGYCHIDGVLNKTVSVRNNTDEMVLLRWNGDARNIFHVYPETAELDSSGTIEFTVSFTPTPSGTFFEAYLECHIMYGALLDYEYIETYQLIPPWMLRLHVAGHTATMELQSLLRPKLEVQSGIPIIVRNIDIDAAGFATALITNPTNDTVYFRSEKDGSGDENACPRFGVLQPGDSKLVLIRATIPVKEGYSKNVTFVLNDNEELTEVYPVLAYNDPEIRVSFANDLHFQDTAVGLASRLPFEMYNNSDFPVRVEWLLTEATRTQFLDIDGKDYAIAAYESRICHLTFHPQNIMVYEEEIIFRVTPLITGCPFATHRVRVAGTGAVGHLLMPDEVVALDNIIVRDTLAYTFPIMNPNQFQVVAHLSFDLIYPDGSKEAIGPADAAAGDQSSNPVQVSQCRFDLQGRTEELLNLRITPTRPGLTTLIVSSIPSLPVAFAETRKVICHVQINACEPKLQVIDVVGSGALGVFGKYRLWNLFGIERLNHLLEKPVTSFDHLEQVLLFGANNIPRIKGQCALTSVNLGTFVTKETAVAKLMFHNPGNVACKWQLKFLDELLLDIPKRIPQNSLPEDYIWPRKAHMPPGSTTVVHLKVLHAALGNHLLPLLFEIDKGKLICIQLTFCTISSQCEVVMGYEDTMEFGATVVTDIHPRKMNLELYNPSNFTVCFRLSSQRTPSDVFHYDTNPHFILPRRFKSVPMTFKPLGLTTYHEQINVVSQQGITHTARVTGRGCSQTEYCTLASAPNIPCQVLQENRYAGLLMSESEILQLSTSRLHFECTPLFSSKRKILFLTNKSQRTYRFKWSVRQSNKHLRVLPESGLIKPGKRVLITMTHFAGSQVCDFVDTLTMEFVDDMERFKYQSWLNGWLAEAKERCRNFIITESNPNADKCVADDLQYIETLENVYYEANHNLSDGDRVVEEVLLMLQRRTDVQVQPLMEPPRIHEIHLTCSGGTLSHELFRKAFPGQVDMFVFEHGPPDPHSVKRPPDTQIAGTGALADLSPMETSQLNSATATLADRLIRSLTGDECFETDVAEVLRYPVKLQYADFVNPKGNADQEGSVVGEDGVDFARVKDRSAGTRTRNFDESSPGYNEGMLSESSQGKQIDSTGRKKEETEILCVSPRTIVVHREELTKVDQEYQVRPKALGILIRRMYSKPWTLRR